MLKKISEIEGTLNFCFINGDLCVINEDNQLIFKKNKARLFSSPLNGWEIFDEKIFVSDWTANYKVFDFNLEELCSGHGKGFFHVSDNFLGCQYLSNSGKVIEGLRTLSGDIIEIGEIQKFNDLNYFFEGLYILINAKKNIVTYEVSKQKIKWEHSILGFGTFTNLWQEEKPYEVKRFVGVWNNQLIVQLTGGKFIGLDIENGDLLWDADKVVHNQTNQQINYGFGDPYNPFLDEEKGHVYILQGEDFIDFDLNKLEASYVWNVKDKHPEKYPFIRQSRILDGKIYFTGRSTINVSNDDMIGVFDIEKKEIIWQHIFDFEKGTFIPNSQDNIQVNEKNLLVLDNFGILHIFEKE